VTPKGIGICLLCVVLVGGTIVIQMMTISRKASGQMPSDPNFGPGWECTTNLGGRGAGNCLRIPLEPAASEASPIAP
jgi:hypothetical protein